MTSTWLLLQGNGGIGTLADSHPPALRDGMQHRSLQNVTGANWAHKPYHYRAMSQPGELQITPPYLSATFQVNGRTCVLCCDVEWLEEEL